MPIKQQQLLEALKEAQRKAQDLVIVKGFTNCRKYVLNIYGGICQGVQALLFNDKDEATEYILHFLSPLYRQLGKRLRLNLA